MKVSPSSILLIHFLLAFTLSLSAQNTTIQHTCDGLDNGAVHVNMILPAPNEPFTYHLVGLSPNTPQIISNEPSFEDLPEGEYQLVILDKDDCVIFSVVNIEQGTHLDCCKLILDTALTHTSLVGTSDGSIDLTLSFGEGTAQLPPYTYQWYQPGVGSVGSTEDISGLATGEYCVDVFDNRGCTASLCVEIEAQQCVDNWISVELAVYPTTHTDNADGRIYIDKRYTSRNFTFEWDGPTEVVEEVNDEGEKFAQNLSVGLYCMTITDLDFDCVHEECIYVADGCTLYENYTRLIAPNKIIPETPINLGSFGSEGYSHIEDSGEIPAGTGIGGIYYISEETGESVSSAEVSAGIYCIVRPLVVRNKSPHREQEDLIICWEEADKYCFEIPYDPNPCATRVIEAEVVGNCMTEDFSVPADGSITLQLSTDEFGWVEPITYQWDDPWSSTTPQLTNLFGGTYCVTVSDAENCSKTECFEVSSNRMEVSVKSIVPYCVGYPGRIEIEVQGDYTPPLSYSWTTQTDYGFPNTFSSGSNVHDNLYANTYCVRVEDAAGCIFTQCGLEVSWEQITEGSKVDGVCYKEIFCGNDRVDRVPVGWEYEPIPETCNALILCNGVPTGGIQAGVEVDSWYEILDNTPTLGPTDGCGGDDDPIFNCIGCVKWMECNPGGRSEIPDTEAFEIEVYDFDFVETECGEGEVVCGFCELQFNCPSTGDDITEEVKDRLVQLPLEET